ncbi:CPBP family intramembrane glutamic endopeptidase [Staphylococcus caledonicus]|uniref:CPBP family intramembrane glutamic endopeptidase n=1 Tax=Staphylococcus caledonicus TaxID=2741333 RepID=UPI0038CD78C5
MWSFRDKTNQYITNILFILVSTLLFWSIHLAQSLLMSLTHLFASVTLAIIFVITKNLFITITIHALNNLISFNHINEIQTYKLLSVLLIISIIVFSFSNIKEKS